MRCNPFTAVPGLGDPMAQPCAAQHGRCNRLEPAIERAQPRLCRLKASSAAGHTTKAEQIILHDSDAQLRAQLVQAQLSSSTKRNPYPGSACGIRLARVSDKRGNGHSICCRRLTYSSQSLIDPQFTSALLIMRESWPQPGIIALT